MNTFGEPGAFEGTASAPVVGGTINALLTDSNLGAATSAASVSRLVGVFSATKAVTITDETKGLEVQFIVTNQGGGVESCARDEGPDNNDAQEEEERLRAEEDREIAESGGAEEMIIRLENARSLRNEIRDKQDRERLEGINSNLAKVCTFGSGPFPSVLSLFDLFLMPIFSITLFNMF